MRNAKIFIQHFYIYYFNYNKLLNFSILVLNIASKKQKKASKQQMYDRSPQRNKSKKRQNDDNKIVQYDPLNQINEYKCLLKKIQQYQKKKRKKAQRMDRLFGKQISNLIDPLIHNKVRQLGRVHSQLTRSISQDPNQMAVKKFNKSIVGNHLHLKCDKEDNSLTRSIQTKTDAKDLQFGDEYFQDCFKFMMSQQSKNHHLKNYITQQTLINQRMRGILLDWLIDLHHKFTMFPQTLYIMVMIIDKYLSKKTATKENLQLVGTAALFIAAKYQEIYQVPELDDLVHFAAKAFTKDQIIKMQADIIDTLQFNLVMQTSFKFFEPMAKICKMDDKNFHLVQYVLQMSLLQTKYLDCKPSLLASSAIYLINKIRKRPEVWPKTLQSLTGYSEKQLKSCARDLCHLLERADVLPNNKSLKKKFSLTQYHEVTRIKVQRKKQ